MSSEAAQFRLDSTYKYDPSLVSIYLLYNTIYFTVTIVEMDAYGRMVGNGGGGGQEANVRTLTSD